MLSFTAMSVLLPAFTFVGFAGLIIGFCILIHQSPCSRSSNGLRLRGLSRGPFRRPDVESTRFRSDDHTRHLMDTLKETGMDHENAPGLVSRLHWLHRLNHFLDILHNTEESIQHVAAGISMLMNYHEAHQQEAEEDLVNLVFTRVLQDGNLSHLYAKLFKRLRKGSDKAWTLNIVRRLFQLCVDEFNAVYPEYQESALLKCRRANNVKLMASMFKRELPGIPDDWITDCANSLIRRVDQDVNEQTVKELHLFVKTLLLPEPGENCAPIHPSRQRQLLDCFDAIERAASPRRVQPTPAPEKFDGESSAEDEDVGMDGCEADTDSESETASGSEDRRPLLSHSDSESECVICSDGYEVEVGTDSGETEDDSDTDGDETNDDTDTDEDETEEDTDTDDDESEGDTDRYDLNPKPEMERKTVKPIGLIEGIIVWVQKAVNVSEMAKKKLEDERSKMLEEERILQEYRAEMRKKTAAAAERRILNSRIRYPVRTRRH
ncbi:uncharacterized protein LOC132087908 [Daphnia carinata]|uniref:uncharacterized protein LOC132087908 n=1 Tax=Daphnia carinata TaxID=120202 RepID=UPI002868C83B|nr:uncharacterized protein LOC132087908 [Daphnia carinata]